MIHKVQFGTTEYETVLRTMSVSDIIDLNYDDPKTNKEWIQVELIKEHGYTTISITHEVYTWMYNNYIKYPFNAEDEFQFKLTFG